MRKSILFSTLLLLTPGITSAIAQTVKIDTLIQQPAEAGDLTPAVVAWLEAREYLIPLPYEKNYEDEDGNKLEYGNTLIGAFSGGAENDIAVLTATTSASDDSCRLWVFPAGDTLAPMLAGTHSISEYFGGHWFEPIDIQGVFGYIFRLTPFGADHIQNLKDCGAFEDDAPAMDHAGINLGLADQGGGWYYYYDGSGWQLLPGCD